MVRFSKRKKEFTKILEQGKLYSLDEAISHVEKFPKTKFDETVEIHFRLNIDGKSSEEAVRGTAVLPNGTGREVKIVVICQGEDVVKAQNLGADHVGGQELIDKIAGGFMDFDTIIATPDMMRDLSKLGKVLGPRGLMPSPKAGTVTTDLERVIKEVKAGRVEFKSDKQAGVHVGIGKRSFTKEQLLANAKHLIDTMNNAKPTAVKLNLIKNMYISSTMGPGLRVKV